MYQVQNRYEAYYKDYINRDVREFRLDCKILGKTISQSDIASVKIEYDLLSGAEEYTIGNLAAAKLTLVVSNKIAIYETNAIDLTISLKIVEPMFGEYWVPVNLGRFYVFDVSTTSLSRTITAYDDLYKTALENIYNSELEYPISVHKILDEICPKLGISYDSNIPNDTIERPETVTEVVYDKGKYVTVVSESNQVCLGMKLGQALMYIASYLNGNFMVDGDRCLKLITYPDSISKSLDSTKYAVPTTSLAYYNMNQIDCTVYQGNVISVGYDENSSCMVLENPFMDKARLLKILSKLNSIKYYQSKVKIKGDPTLQLGDLVEIKNIRSDGSIIDTQQIPILRMTFNYTGGCTNEIEAPCKPVAEKNINYKGTISSRVDNLESSVSNIQSTTQEIYESLGSLKTVKDNVDDMNIFIKNNTAISDEKFNRFQSILTKIEESNEAFEDEYNEIYNNKHL